MTDFFEIECECDGGWVEEGGLFRYCRKCLDGINMHIKDLRGEIAQQELELENLIAKRDKKIAEQK